MADNSLDHQIGEAWKAHRQGMHEAASEQFRQILEQDPNHLDALYGLGLAEKSMGNFTEAHDIFVNLQEKIAGVGEEESLSGHPGKFHMLATMVRQQLRQIAMGVK